LGTGVTLGTRIYYNTLPRTKNAIHTVGRTQTLPETNNALRKY